MPDVPLPSIPSRALIHERLNLIFPEGTTHRGDVTEEMAVNTISVFFYIGAVEGFDNWVQPGHIYYMSDSQFENTSETARNTWAKTHDWDGGKHIQNPWYPAQGNRESLRKFVIKRGLMERNAVILNRNFNDNANKGRYGLSRQFAALFNENLIDTQLNVQISHWQQQNLNPETQIAVGFRRITTGVNRIQVTYPDQTGSTLLPSNDSSLITKMVIEKFSTIFLTDPHVISFSTSEHATVTPNPQIIRGLDFANEEVQKILPDVVLFDTFQRNGSPETLLVFVEVVATSNPVTQNRKNLILSLLNARGYDTTKVAFVTAFLDRSHKGFSGKNLRDVAWGSYIWIASSPRDIILMKDADTINNRKLHDLIE